MTKKEKLKRIIYWWRRYMGRRDKQEGKVWLASDIDVLTMRLIKWIENPKMFNFDYPDMGIDDFGFAKEKEGVK